jgi:CMP-N,N'-diacetyllegionaminic acid synthase
VNENLEGISILAVVPARGGSIGVPRKNLAQVGGISLIARTANVIAKLPWIARSIISTDDTEMRDEGVRYGLDAPFLRPAELSHATASADDVLFHAWVECERYYRVKFEYALYLQPTSPLRLAEDVERTLKALILSNFDSAATVSPMPAHFAPERIHLIGNDGSLQFYLASGRALTARQQVRQYYFRNGEVYALRRDAFLRTRKIFGDNMLAVVINRPTVNIDEPIELELAEWMLSNQADR